MPRQSTPNDGSAQDAGGEYDAVMLDAVDISDSDGDGFPPQSAETLAEARQWLEPTNYNADDGECARHLASHLEGTGRWLFVSTAYSEWKSSKEHGLLWIRGIPGSGKSVIAATLVDQLRQEGVPVLYFFFRQTIDANRSPVTALRDWLDQILVSSPPLQLVVEEYLDTKRSLESVSTADLWRHLRLALSQLPRAYLVVDALDEMDRGDKMQTFIQGLAELGQWRPSKVKVIITSRPVQYVEDHLRAAKALHLRLQERLVDVDITTYVRHRLSKSLIPVEYHELVKDALPGRANGLFLYAKLAMDALVQPDADIQQALRDLPSNLSDMYADLLREHARRTNTPADIQLLILQFVTHATRPLRLLELSEMINVTQYPQEQRDLKATKDLVRAACGPLLEILPSETVCVVHHSLTEFLTGETRRSAPNDYPILEFGPTHNRLAYICLSYLQSAGLSEVELDPDDCFPGKSPDTKLLSAFTRYAGRNWFVHVRKATSAGVDQSGINSLLDTLFVTDSLERMALLSDEPDLDQQKDALFAAVALGLGQYTRKLLSRPGTRLDRGEEMVLGPLSLAAKKGYVEMAELLLQHGADPMEREAGFYSCRTPLHHAATNNHPTVVTLLLNAGVDPLVTDARNHRSDGPRVSKGTPLEYACNRGHVEAVTAFIPFLKTSEAVNAALFWAMKKVLLPDVVELLVGHPLVQVNALGPNLTSPLLLACGCRDVRSVRCLLDAGADPNQLHEAPWIPFGKANRGFTALHCWAAGVKDPGSLRHEHQEIDAEVTRECFRLLVSAGANIHQRDPEGNTPLQVACDLVAARLLVDAGADPNAVNDRGETLLHYACDKSIVRFLIEEAKVSNNPKNCSAPPLLTFIKNGNVESALMLLESGADAAVIDKNGDGAFHLAIRHGKPKPGNDDLRERLIETLRSAGADVNLKNKNGQSPLHHFSYDDTGYGKAANTVLLAMVAAGADLEARDIQGQTPLWANVDSRYYSGCGRIVVCDSMVAAGAILDTRDYRGRNLLYVAAEYGDISLLQWLVSHGVDPKATDHKGNTVFHDLMLRANQYPYGGHARSFDLFDELIRLGVDPTRPNHAGKTPLHSISATQPCLERHHSTRPARRTTAFDYVLALLHKTVNSADHVGVTPLHLAATFSEYQSKRLLEAGADPSIATYEGMTGFHLAARGRQPNIIGRLLDSLESRLGREAMKPILDAEANYRKTALYYACASGRVQSVKLLLEAGASVSGKYLDMAVDGCAAFETELANWPRHNVEDDSLPDAGSVEVDGTHRTNSLDWDGRYPTTTLDEILALLASSAPSMESCIDSAVSRAAGFGSDYTVDCLLRIRSQLSPDKPFKFGHESFACLARREAIRRAYEDGVPDGVALEPRWGQSQSELDYLMSIREYGLARDRLAKDGWVKIQDDMHIVLHELVGGGFASLLADVLTPALLEKVENPLPGEEAAQDYAGRRRTPDFLLITACQRETPNMDVVRLLVERFNIDVNKANKANKNLANKVNKTNKNFHHGFFPTCHKTALHALADGTYWWQTAQAIPYLVKQGADLEARYRGGLTPLNDALDKLVENLGFNRRAVETLVELGADVNSADDSGVSCVARAISDKDVLGFLLSRGATVGPKALFAAVEKANVDALEVLLLHGADPNGRSPSLETHLRTTWSRGSSRHSSSGLADDQLYPLHYVATLSDSEDRSVHEQMMRLLLKHGADPNARYRDTTVAHQVIENGTFIELFLQLPSLDIEATDADGATLFLAACHNAERPGQDSRAKQSGPAILLSRGADIRARDKAGRNALHRVLEIALDREDPDTLRRLAAEPDLLNSPDNKGRTPIHQAAQRFTRAVRELDVLLAAGADPWIADAAGDTLMHTVFREGIWRQKVASPGSGPGELRCDVLERVIGLPGAEAFVNARNRAGETPVFGYIRGSAHRAHGLGKVDDVTGTYSEPAFAVFDTAGVDWNVANNRAQTLLHLVAEDSVERFKFLLAKGLDPRAEDAKHQTPLDVAAAAGIKGILDLFENVGGTG